MLCGSFSQCSEDYSDLLYLCLVAGCVMFPSPATRNWGAMAFTWTVEGR